MKTRNKEIFTAFKEAYGSKVPRKHRKGTIDESPMAYKDTQMILDAISPTADVEFLIKPLYNFKAGELLNEPTLLQDIATFDGFS